mgnify:CR=1 FL=1
MKKSKQWLVKNAVMAWLVNYAQKEAGELTADYQELFKELEDEQPDNTATRKRGRPAKRQRTKKASSDPPSTEKNETTKEET